MFTFIAHFFEGSTEAVLRRFAENRKRETVIHVDITGTIGNQPTKSDLWIDRSRYKVKFVSKLGNWDYAFAQSAGRAIELERNAKVYDRHSAGLETATWMMMGSKIASVSEYIFPAGLIEDLSKTAAKGKTTTVPGGDRVDWIFESRDGKVAMTATIDPNGRLIAMTQGATTDPAKSWQFKYLPVPSQIPASQWTLNIPDGYVPYKLPAAEAPLAPGSKFPMTGWTDTRNNASVDLRTRFGGKSGIVAVLGNDPTSASVVPSLQRLYDAKIPLVVVTADGAKPGKGWLLDKSGELLTKLSYSATPTFYFVSGKGELTVIMVGFDVNNRAGFEKEARQHIQEDK